MSDKYKVAANLKKDNPKLTHKEVLKIADEVVKIYFDCNCTVEEAVKKAKEILGVNQLEGIKEIN